MAKPTKPELSESEIAKRRDAGLLNLLKAPPKPHAEIVGKPKGKKKGSKRKGG
jgi:hypothetical protein